MLVVLLKVEVSVDEDDRANPAHNQPEQNGKPIQIERDAQAHRRHPVIYGESLGGVGIQVGKVQQQRHENACHHPRR